MLKYFIIGNVSGAFFIFLLLIPRIYISFKNRITLEQRIKRLEKLQNNNNNNN